MASEGQSAGATGSVASTCAAPLFFNPGIPVFNMKINGKMCDVLFDTGSTVNILGKDTLVKY